MKYHRWTEEDDIVTLYLYKFGDVDIPFSLEDIGERLGMGVSSLRMRIANFKAIDRKGGLTHFGQQSLEVYDKYKRTPEDELKSEVLKILRKSMTRENQRERNRTGNLRVNTQDSLNLRSLNDKELLRLYGSLIEELRQRKLVRSSNNPVSDYAEKIVCEKMNLSLERGSNKGYDAIDEKTGLKYQIKTRRLTRHNKSRQLGVIRNLDQKLFDFLIAVFFDESLEPQEIWRIPRETIPKFSRYSAHQNGHILILAGKVLQDKDVTRLL